MSSSTTAPGEQETWPHLEPGELQPHEPSPGARGVLAGMSQLGADTLEAGSRAILHQAAAARTERHFSLPCRDKTASCDSRSLLPSPRSVCHTAAIDKTLKEQEVSLAEAPGRASCGCTANEPKWSTLLKAFPSFQALTAAPAAACLAATVVWKGMVPPAPPPCRLY